MAADLVVYAIVAAVLVFWLRGVLGTRHGDERERPNPYIASVEGRAENGMDPDTGRPGMDSTTPEEKISALSQDGSGPLAIADAQAESGLLRIAEVDRDFDVKFFLGAAQDAFVLIVEAFAAGDLDTLRGLVSPPVFSAFEQAIAQRAARGEAQTTEISSFRRSEILYADVAGRKTARITVRFEAQETSVTRDRTGQVVAGSPDKTTRMVDVWTFERKLSSNDPTWILVETRSGDPNDTDPVPASH